MALQVAIIADDLTGALDSAAPFATHGLRVAVAPFVDACDEAEIADCDVFAINTETRALAPEAAAVEVARAWERVAAGAPGIVFKKIDSRLKGNVGAEVAALMAASGRSQAIVAPAIPEMGRFVVAGAVVGFGVDGALAISERIHLGNDSAPDCTDVETLGRIAAMLVENRETHLAVGAAGLAEALAKILGHRPAPSSARQRNGPVLVIAGSRDPITLEQVARLERSDLRVFAFSPHLLDIPEVPGDVDVIVVRPTQDKQGASPEHVAQTLARIGRALIERVRIETVVVTGGDTASAFVREAGIRVLKPDGAFMLGVPTAQATIGARALTLITKSGGFGSPETLIDIARSYAGPRRGLSK